MEKKAHLSPDRKCRYWLLRRWDSGLPLIAFIAANPSTADEKTDDPTIRREIGFAQRWGYGGILALNVAAFRATKPEDCRAARDPIGPNNTTAHLSRYLSKFHTARVVAAWGNKTYRWFPSSCDAIKEKIPDLWCLGITSLGSPKHPLYLADNTETVRLAQALKRFCSPHSRLV